MYRKWGYEFAGFRRTSEWPSPICRWAAYRAAYVTNAEVSELSVREMDKNEIGEVMTCFSKFARRFNGPVETADPAFWVHHSLAHAGEGTYQRTAVVVGKDGIAGYASYFLEERPGEAVKKRRFVSVSTWSPIRRGPVQTLLIRYFRRFENAAEIWCGWAR